MAKKVFITGITGFVGSHLVEHLIKTTDWQISGAYLSEESRKNITSKSDRIKLLEVDLNDKARVARLLSDTKPEYIFHLAALTSPYNSFKYPVETIVNNVKIQINVLESVLEIGLLKTKILIVSSADVYGIVAPQDIPIDEETKFNPANPYAVSKITQDYLALQYFISYKLPIIRVRPFNHIGPRQSPDFVVASFAKKIAEIEKGMRPRELSVGNLEAKRDFTDVLDIVKGYCALIKNGTPGDVYNIGSGKSLTIKEVLDKLLALSSVKIAIKQDKALLRPSDTPELVCDNRKLVNLTHWHPEIDIDTTLKQTLDYWRDIV